MVAFYKYKYGRNRHHAATRLVESVCHLTDSAFPLHQVLCS